MLKVAKHELIDLLDMPVNIDLVAHWDRNIQPIMHRMGRRMALKVELMRIKRLSLTPQEPRGNFHSAEYQPTRDEEGN